MPPYGASSIGETSFSPEQFTWMQGGNVMGCRPKIALQSILVHTPSDLHLQILPGSIVEHTHASSGDKNLQEGILPRVKKCVSFHLMSKYLRISSSPYVSMHHLHNSHWNIMTLLSYTIASRCIKLRSQTCCQVASLASAGEWPSCASTNHHGILISVALQHHAVTLDLIFAAFPSHQSDCNSCNWLSEKRVQLCCAQNKICCTAAVFCNALHQAVGNAPAKAHLKRIGSSRWHTCFIFSCIWFFRIFNLSL